MYISASQGLFQPHTPNDPPWSHLPGFASKLLGLGQAPQAYHGVWTVMSLEQGNSDARTQQTGVGLPQVMNVVQAGCGNTCNPSDQVAEDCSRRPFLFKKEKEKAKGEGCVLCRFWALLMRLPHLLFLCNCLRAYWVKFWGYKQQSEPVKLFVLVHAALCLLSMCVAPGCISLSAWVTCVLHFHLLGLLVLETHLPQIHSPGVCWARSSGPSELWRERLLNSVFISWLTYPKPNSS